MRTVRGNVRWKVFRGKWNYQGQSFKTRLASGRGLKPDSYDNDRSKGDSIVSLDSVPSSAEFSCFNVEY